MRRGRVTGTGSVGRRGAKRLINRLENAFIAELEDGEQFGILPDQISFLINEEVGAAHPQKSLCPIKTSHMVADVTEEAEWDAALLGKLAMPLHLVGADSQNGDVSRLVLGVIIAEGADLSGADGGKVRRIKENKDGIPLAEPGKSYLFPVVRRERKIRRGLMKGQNVRQNNLRVGPLDDKVSPLTAHTTYKHMQFQTIAQGQIAVKRPAVRNLQ